MTVIEWAGAAMLLIVLLILCSAGFYRAGYAKGYLASHKNVLEMNENFKQVVAVARQYEREFGRLEKDGRI